MFKNFITTAVKVWSVSASLCVFHLQSITRSSLWVCNFISELWQLEQQQVTYQYQAFTTRWCHVAISVIFQTELKITDRAKTMEGCFIPSLRMSVLPTEQRSNHTFWPVIRYCKVQVPLSLPNHNEWSMVMISLIIVIRLRKFSATLVRSTAQSPWGWGNDL